jgi:hypothetical protein
MRNPKHEIMLMNTKDGLMAHYLVSGQPDPEITALFGTHIIPTPYTSASSMPVAAAEIRRLNPGCTVSVV